MTDTVTRAGGADALLSQRANSAPGTYFPAPPVPITYSFDQGQPAPETYPIEELAEYTRQAILTAGEAACDYITTPDELSMGYAGLRELLAERTARRDGLTLDRRNVMLVHGSAHGLSLMSSAFLDPGDGVVVEASTFPFMVGYMAARGARIATVAVEDDGMDVEAVDAACARFAAEGTRPKLVYTIPAFQVPTGTVLSLEKRRRLLEIAEKWDLAVIEDNCYSEKWFDTPPPPTLLSLDPYGRVVHSDSFSKMLAPGLRLGWAVGSPAVIGAMGAVREDLGVNQIIPRAVESYIRDGHLEPHLERARVVNRHKRDVALAALREHCEPLVRFRVPGGGIYFWLELAPEVDVDAVRTRLLEHGVACRPGEKFTGDESGRRFLRMAFLHVTEEEIRRGVALLGEALRASAS